MTEQKELHCPVDGAAMVVQPHGIGRYHACLSCRGLWVPRTFLLALKSRAVQKMKRDPVEPLPPVKRTTPLTCPECSSAMLPRLQDTVPVDILKELAFIVEYLTLKIRNATFNRAKDFTGSDPGAVGGVACGGVAGGAASGEDDAGRVGGGGVVWANSGV